MNKQLLSLPFFILILVGKLSAQFLPISTTNYNFDGVAEASTAMANTTGQLDGSNWVLYSAAYGALYSATTGLPNNGLISTSTRTYQLQPYNQNNILFLPGNAVDSIIFSTPAPYGGLSLLCFSTEGNGGMTATVRFTDNTTQVFTGLNLLDWFSPTGTPIIGGVDRANRGTGALAGVATAGNPKIFNVDLVISCANRVKNVQNIKIQNTLANPRNCILAVSGVGAPTFTANAGQVSCSGGTNGTATIIPTGGIAPYTYTWSTTPVLNTTSIANMPAGIYSFTAQDAALCANSYTVAITTSTLAQPPLSVVASAYSVCIGNSVTIAASGAVSYSWSNTTANTSTTSATPASTSVYTVGGYTSFNCFRSGSVTIVVNQPPVITFTTPPSFCLNTPQYALTASPIGGVYTGTGVVFGNYHPNLAGLGTKTISYSYTDINGCNSVSTTTVVVNPQPVLGFTLSQNSLCTNSPTLALTATPGGGTFSGNGVIGNTAFSSSQAGVGTHVVMYTYTDANGCTSSSVSSVPVYPVPPVSITTTKKLYCINSSSLFLNANPSGGTYSGPGVTNNSAFTASLAGVGTHTIAYAYTDLNSCTGTAVLSVTVSACTGIENYGQDNALFSVYPNPSNGTFTIKTSYAMSLIIHDELGRTVRSFKSNETNGYQTFISDLAPGVYFISGEKNAQLVREKIIVTK